MVVAIRLARHGRRHAPYYRIMVADSRRARDGKYLEHVGSYDPLIKDGAKHLRINTERVTYWLSVGAQPSDTVRRSRRRVIRVSPMQCTHLSFCGLLPGTRQSQVARLLEKANILPPRPRYSDVPALPRGVRHAPAWLAHNALPKRPKGKAALPSYAVNFVFPAVLNSHRHSFITFVHLLFPPRIAVWLRPTGGR